MAEFDLLRFMDRAEWMADANCLGLDTELFFPERGELTRWAKEVCRACDVQAECLAYALNNGEHHGIWGGVSERERRTMRRARAANAAGPIPPPASCSVMSTAVSTATSAIATSAPSRAGRAARPTARPTTSERIGA